jgi:hypothetical protein
MTLIDRFSMLLFQPDAATYDLYDQPAFRDALVFVTIYAVLSGLSSVMVVSMDVGGSGFLFITFLGSFLVVYLMWVFLSLGLHIAASAWGGSGLLPNAFGYVGLATAPMILTTAVAVVSTIILPSVVEDDPQGAVRNFILILTLVGMAWGWPGILCYFGMRNAERLDSFKAFILVLIAFCIVAGYVIISSNVLE